MQKYLTGAAVVAIATLAVAGSASATVSVTNVVGNSTPYAVVVDFDNAPTAGYTLSGTYSVFASSQGNAAQPPSDPTSFAGLQGGESLTIHSVAGFTGFSFYMGSPDDYNYVTVDGVTLNGSALMGLPFVSSDGNQSVGRTVFYNLGGDVAHDITFSSNGVAFEFDNIAVAGVPEPATWALMIGGFGLAGVALRRRRAALAT
jgi:hypothetical protein